MNIQKIVLSAIIVIAIASIPAFYLTNGAGFTPITDTYKFERDVKNDSGRKLDATSVVATDGTRLSEIFSEARMLRYGFDVNEKNVGVGLEVAGIIKNGDQVLRTIKFEGIPRWETFEEGGDNEARNNLVAAKKKEFQGFMEQFTSSVDLNFTFAVVLDTTEGVSSLLSRRVQETIEDTKAAQFAKDGHSVVMNLYHITDSAYQGGRRRVRSGTSNMEEDMKWFLSNQADEKSSSVLRGLEAIFKDVEGYANTAPRIDVFTDGLENLPEFSVYKNPELLDEANWSKIDQIADLSKLKLQGVEIHLHPLPPTSRQHENMMEKGLRYLADRLTKAGARVRVEPI